MDDGEFVVYADTPLGDYFREFEEELVVDNSLAPRSHSLFSKWWNAFVTSLQMALTRVGFPETNLESPQTDEFTTATTVIRIINASLSNPREAPPLPAIHRNISWISRSVMLGGTFTVAAGIHFGWRTARLSRLQLQAGYPPRSVIPAAATIIAFSSGWEAVRWWRSYRSYHSSKRVVESVHSFVTTAMDLDSVCSKAIRHVQEISVVSHRYRLTSVLPPIARIEQAHTTALASALRRAVHNALTVSTTSLNHATNRILALLSNTSPSAMTEDDPVRHDASAVSIAEMKVAQHEFRDAREELMEAVLMWSRAVGRSGRKEVVKFEGGVSDVMREVGGVLKRGAGDVGGVLGSQQDLKSAMQAQSQSGAVGSKNMKIVDITRGLYGHFVQELVGLDNHLQSMKIKLYLCFERLQCLSPDSPNPDPELLSLWDTFAQDLVTLQTSYEHANAKLLDPTSAHVRINEENPRWDARPDAGYDTLERRFVDHAGLEEDGLDGVVGAPEEVYEEEGGVDEEGGRLGRSKIPRAERIRLRQEKLQEDERAKEVIRASKASREILLRELTDVLSFRQRLK
ncbi:hypothetical protein BJ742DRAFT_794627 [Cladochytrium replicatum]|nr:hypothetical protein BJ742DRAFT_794627 [Cladochytrium replicatum]